MRKRLSLIWVLAVLGAAMALPASTAAANGHDYQVVYNRCNGANPEFKVKNIARGWSNANKLTNESWVEKKPGGRGQTWSKVYTWDKAQYKFKKNGDKHWLTSWRTWTGNRYNWFRIGFRLRAWNGTHLIDSVTLYSKKC
jgi:hypothetical protein